MNREILEPRKNWRVELETQGVDYHTVEDIPYWNESACYVFTLSEINRIESATNALHELAIAAVENIIEKHRFFEMGIDDRATSLILHSWNNPNFDELSVFGRFDLAYDGQELKMLEYNADTPTSLPEAAVCQWKWLEEVRPDKDQFNSIHEKLIERWKKVGLKHLHLSCLKDTSEDYGNVRYMADVAEQAGIKTKFLFIEDIGWDNKTTRFIDLEGQPIFNLFKLYPWEWMISDVFADKIEAARFIEPAWKMLLSNKAILAIMWDLAPNHPNLLEASLSPISGSHISKPTLSREGANISIFNDGVFAGGTDGPYKGKQVYQRLASIPNFNGNYPVLGSWIIGEEAAGMSVRESDTPITGNLSRFVPHYIT